MKGGAAVLNFFIKMLLKFIQLSKYTKTTYKKKQLYHRNKYKNYINSAY